MPHRDYLAYEMGVSDDARAVLSNSPPNACEGMDEPTTEAHIGLYNVLLKQSGLSFLPLTELATAKQSMQRMSTVLHGIHGSHERYSRHACSLHYLLLTCFANFTCLAVSTHQVDAKSVCRRTVCLVIVT